jgi:hypothetical protein
MSNAECGMRNCGIALRGVGAAIPTSRRLRSIFFDKAKINQNIRIDRIP